MGGQSPHVFSQVPKAEIPRSRFNRSCGHKTTFNSGYLIPVFVDEALPGDTFNCRMTAFARLATPLKPIMDNMYMDSFFFSVPIRLVWNNWQKFNGEQLNPDDSTDYVIPKLGFVDGGFQVGSLYDYFGLPTEVNFPANYFSSLFVRCYNLIWNEWFRDQNLQDSVSVPKGDGPDSVTLFNLLRRGKRHDYFTSCLPWPQKGPAVELPLGGRADVKGIGVNANIDVFNGTYADVRETGASSTTTWTLDAAEDATASFVMRGTAGYPDVYADLSTATAATINSLREAFQIQKMYERDARGGTRYTEIVRSHFGVVSPDARLQRPEYLGGSSSPVSVAAIAQTSGSPSGTGYTDTPQGNLAAMGTVHASGHGFTKSFTEHCIIIGLVSVRADLNYQNGINKMFSRSTRFDFYWPALSHLGEQAVLNKEIYAQGTGNELIDDSVFGYQERFAEYRYKPSLITGQFRSSYAQSLDIWHLAQDYTALPVLGDVFIQENPPIARVIAVPSEPEFLFDSYFNLSCVRPMPVYSVPGMIDHF